MSMSVTAANNSLPLPPPTGNPFDDIMTAYFGGFDSPAYAATAAGKKQAIWLSFLQANNLTSVTLTPSAQQDKELDLLRAFVRQINIDVFQPIPPAAGQYGLGSIMNSFFGELSAGKQQDIWLRFLNLVPTEPQYEATLVNGFNAQYPNGLLAAYNAGTLVDDDFTQKLFITYIQKAIASNEITIVSYTNQVFTQQEIKKRQIMFEVLDAVIDMLLSLQDTVIAQANNLAFYARWQKEYTAMLTRVPTYVGAETSNVQTINVNDPNADWSKFTLGYNDISVEDIAKWWAQQRADGKSETYTIKHQDTRPTVAGGPFGLTTELSITPTQISFSIQGVTAFQTPIVVSEGIATGTSFDENVSNFVQAFKTFYTDGASTFWLNFSDSFLNSAYNQLSVLPLAQNLVPFSQIYAPSANSSDPRIALSIWKPYTYVAPSNLTDPSNQLRALSDASAKARGEINARDQQYIENIRSKRQIVQDTQSEMQSNLDQSRQTLTQQTDLINSLIDSLKGLISSIFR